INSKSVPPVAAKPRKTRFFAAAPSGRFLIEFALATREKPTEAEARILLEAQRNYIIRGNTAVRCPRCGKPLEYRCGENGETICCTDELCIVVYTRGI
ncbi:MAG: hypothetical protein FWB80_12195, partial [Defluviitaleaceae bacterium]|nr:hypothetical protein [Defluviitaleaceae bacterium]